MTIVLRKQKNPVVNNGFIIKQAHNHYYTAN